MKLAALAAFLLMLGMASAATQAYPFSFFVPENSSYSLVKFPHQNQTAQALMVQGTTLYAIFVPKSPYSKEIEPLVGKEKIASALWDYYSSLGYSTDAVKAFGRVHGGIAATSNSSKAGEDKCRILLGTDTHECTDFDSCQKACYSVTSFCQVVALGAGRAFVDIIWNFENDSRLLSEAYAREQAAFEAFEQNSSSNASTDYLLSLQNLNIVATRAASSPLYYDYSYCFSPEYNLTEVTSLQLTAQNAYKNASRFYLVPIYAERIQNTTLAGLARKAKFYLEPAKASANAPSNLASSANLSFAPGPQPSGQKEEPLPSFLMQAAVISGAFLLFIGGIMALSAWHLFRKKKPKDALAPKHPEKARLPANRPK